MILAPGYVMIRNLQKIFITVTFPVHVAVEDGIIEELGAAMFVVRAHILRVFAD